MSGMQQIVALWSLIPSKTRGILSIVVDAVLFQEARRPVVPLRDESISVAATDPVELSDHV
jgi:hypothetical protein